MIALVQLIIIIIIIKDVQRVRDVSASRRGCEAETRRYGFCGGTKKARKRRLK